MSAFVYVLCALTALMCSVLTFRSYVKTKLRLLFWCALTFLGLFINNTLLIFDKVIFPVADLIVWRNLSALVALLPLVYGLIWEEE